MKTRKFTTEEVNHIRTTFSAGKGTLDSLAEEFRCSASMIWRIVSGRNYTDAPGPITVVYRPRTGRPKPKPAQRAYATLADFRRHGPRALFDLPEGAIISALVSASAEVDAILGAQGFKLPLSDWSDDTRRATVDIAASMLLVHLSKMNDRVFVSVIGDRAQQAREMLRSARTTPTAPAITVGTTARLIAGGPAMSVIQVHADVVVATWFDASGRNHTATFPTTALEVVQ